MDSRTTSRSATPSTVMPYSVSRPMTRFMCSNLRQRTPNRKWERLFLHAEPGKNRLGRRDPLGVAGGVRVEHIGKFLLLAGTGTVVEERPGVAEGHLGVVLEGFFVEGIELA